MHKSACYVGMHNQNRENVLYADWLILLYCVSKGTCSFAFPGQYHLFPGQYHLLPGQYHLLPLQDQKYCVGAFESMASSAPRPYIFNQSCSSSFFYMILIQYSGKLSRGGNFSRFSRPRRKREINNRELLNAWTFELAKVWTRVKKHISSMALYRYFAEAEDVLPRPSGTLSSSISPAP